MSKLTALPFDLTEAVMTEGRRIARRGAVKRIAAGAAVLAAPAVLRSIEANAQSKLRKMSVYIGTTPHYSMTIVAKDKGFFEAEGLPVEITKFASGSVAVEAFHAARGDSGHVCCAGDLASVRSWTKFGAIGVCPTGTFNHMSMIAAKKTIKTAADMRGKKIGVMMGSTAEYFARKYFLRANVPWNEINVINLQPAEMVIGLAGGDIDAFVLWQPFGWRAEDAARDVHILTTSENYFDEWTLSMTTKAYAKSHESELIAFIRALDAASKWSKENRADAAAVVDANLRIRDLSITRRIMDPVNWTVDFTPKFRSDLDALAEFDNVSIDWNSMMAVDVLRKANPAFVA